MTLLRSQEVQVVLHALIVTAQCFLVAKAPTWVPVFTPGLAVLAAGLGFTLQAPDKK